MLSYRLIMQPWWAAICGMDFTWWRNLWPWTQQGREPRSQVYNMGFTSGFWEERQGHNNCSFCISYNQHNCQLPEIMPVPGSQVLVWEGMNWARLTHLVWNKCKTCEVEIQFNLLIATDSPIIKAEPVSWKNHQLTGYCHLVNCFIVCFSCVIQCLVSLQRASKQQKNDEKHVPPGGGEKCLLSKSFQNRNFGLLSSGIWTYHLYNIISPKRPMAHADVSRAV